MCWPAQYISEHLLWRTPCQKPYGIHTERERERERAVDIVVLGVILWGGVDCNPQIGPVTEADSSAALFYAVLTCVLHRPVRDGKPTYNMLRTQYVNNKQM